MRLNTRREVGGLELQMHRTGSEIEELKERLKKAHEGP